MASFQEAFSGKRFVCCTPTVLYSIIIHTIQQVSLQPPHMISTLRISVNMTARKETFATCANLDLYLSYTTLCQDFNSGYAAGSGIVCPFWQKLSHWHIIFSRSHFTTPYEGTQPHHSVHNESPWQGLMFYYVIQNSAATGEYTYIVAYSYIHLVLASCTCNIVQCCNLHNCHVCVCIVAMLSSIHPY